MKSDAQLHADVAEELAADPSIDAKHTDVRDRVRRQLEQTLYDFDSGRRR